MPLAYAPEEVKERLNSVLAHGDKAEIIARTRLNSTMVKEMFNPECDRNLQLANILEIFVAVYEMNPERGDLMVEAFVGMYESSKVRRTESLSVEEEAAKLAEDAQRVALGRLSRMPDYDSLVGAMKTKYQAERTTKAILNSIAERPPGLLTPPEVIPGWRVELKERINNSRRGR